MRARLFSLMSVAVMLTGLVAVPAGAAGDAGAWIVTLHDAHPSTVHAHALAERHGGEVGFVYSHALNGFSFRGSERAAQNLGRDPRVSSIVADQPVHALEQTLPTGIDRIDADQEASTGSGINVAVLDTGVDLDHEDLAVDASLGKNCIDPTKAPDDGHGHGTHVAGTVAAVDNSLGVVGVAPAVTIVPVKVLSDSGSGSWESVLCGVDHVTAKAASIAVANMSLGGSGSDSVCDDGDTSDALHEGICDSVDAGVVYTVAAGNDSKDADGYVPATYAEVITVSALADFDGKPGGEAGCRLYIGLGQQCDDDLAKFSNYGADVDVIAPGMSILSTEPGNTYGEKSGTSMAAPHVAGLAALAIAANPDLSPADVRVLLRDTGECPDGSANDGGDCSGTWNNDPDGITEPLIHAPRAVNAAPNYTGAGGGGDGGGTTNRAPTASFTYSCTDLSCSFDGTGSSDPDGDSLTYAWDYGDGSTATGAITTHDYGADGTYQVTLTVSDGEATDSETQSVAVSSSSNEDPFALSVTAYKEKGLQKADLSWDSGATTATSVDVYRDGSRITTTANDGFHTDHIDNRGGGSYTYQVCEAGTSTCSNEVTVTY